MIGLWWRIQAELARGTAIPVGPQRRSTTKDGLPVLSGMVYAPFFPHRPIDGPPDFDARYDHLFGDLFPLFPS